MLRRNLLSREKRQQTNVPSEKLIYLIFAKN
jgi:hypothetical protein